MRLIHTAEDAVPYKNLTQESNVVVAPSNSCSIEIDANADGQKSASLTGDTAVQGDHHRVTEVTEPQPAARAARTLAFTYFL